MEQLKAMEPCANCGDNVPEGARFCPRCGAPQVEKNPPPSAATEEGEPAPEWSWCEIEWVRSFRASGFEARPLGPGADDAPARSPTFRWREDKPPPETSAGAREAHEELVHLLVAEGWEPVGNGGPWYAERFRRPARPNHAKISVERPTAPLPVNPMRLGIVVLTLGSLVIIIFTLLVLLGFFVGK